MITQEPEIARELKEEFNALIKLNPNYYLPYEGLGKAYFELGDYEKAESNLRKSLELNPSSEESKKLLQAITRFN